MSSDSKKYAIIEWTVPEEDADKAIALLQAKLAEMGLTAADISVYPADRGVDRPRHKISFTHLQ